MNGRGILIVTALMGCAISSAQINLSHNGTTVDIDENNARTTNWTLDGVDQLFESIWYFRDGDGGAASAVSNIGAASVTMFDLRAAEVVYTDSDLTVTITYLLQAASNGLTSSLSESVTVESNSGINLRLFQYNDFDMDGSVSGDTATRLNSSSIGQSDNGVTVTQGSTTIPGFSEISTFAGLRTDITSTAGYNLNTVAGSGIGESVNGDMTYGFQWNENIASGGSYVVGVDRVAAVPEPASMIALGLGAAALLRRRRRK